MSHWEIDSWQACARTDRRSGGACAPSCGVLREPANVNVRDDAAALLRLLTNDYFTPPSRRDDWRFHGNGAIFPAG